LADDHFFASKVDHSIGVLLYRELPIRNCYKDARRLELFRGTFGNKGNLKKKCHLQPLRAYHIAKKPLAKSRSRLTRVANRTPLAGCKRGPLNMRGRGCNAAASSAPSAVRTYL
jgi:hypothetical protein